MNLSEDFWKDYALMFKLSNKDSPMDRFTIGNMESLKQEGIREALLKFHKDWYSANIMTLAVCSNQSLDELETMITSLFSPVENKNV
jgi:insulysin